MSHYILSEQEIRLINLTLSSIADLSYQGILILNSEGNIIYLNKSYSKFLQKSEAELMGTCPEFLTDNFKNPASKMMLELSKYNNWISEYSFINKTGSTIYLASHIVPLNDSKNITGFICYFTNITEKINIEKKLIKNNHVLINNIMELRDAQSNLIQHEKLAAIGQLSAGVAHELNNPLGFVKSNIEILSDYVDTFIKLHNIYEEICTYVLNSNLEDNTLSDKLKFINDFKNNNNVDYIVKDLEDLVKESSIGIKRASKIVEALRQFSDKNDHEFLDQYDINEGIETTLLISKNHWKYDAHIDKNLGEIPNISANGNQLNQVFLNMITNSIYAIKEVKSKDPSFKGIISISTYMDTSNVYIDFKDNGSGISTEDISKIFDPFFTTKPIGKGTGLGLNISYNIIVNKHNGTVNVESEIGIGTCFKISLPIIKNGGSNETTTNRR